VRAIFNEDHSNEEPAMPEDQITTEEIAPVEETDWPASSEELPPRPRRRLLSPFPLALFGVLLVACGFIGGVLVEKGQTSTSGTGTSGALGARFAALRGASGTTSGTGRTTLGGSASAAGSTRTGISAGGDFAGRFGGAGARSATIGQVAYIEGKTLYVEGAEGNTVKVTTSPASTITKTVTSSVKGIHPGETVVVQGAANSRGTIAASSISVGGAGGLGGGLPGLFGRGGAGARTTGGASGSGEGPALFGR
jgi:hypothetical protein